MPRSRARTPPGSAAEDLVEEHLRARGWTSLAKRLRVGALEIDLLMRRGSIAAIVEVRGRRVDGWSDPLDTIDARKQARLVRAASAIWSQRLAGDATIDVLRIDVAAVLWRPDAAPVVEIIEGAIDTTPG